MVEFIFKKTTPSKAEQKVLVVADKSFDAKGFLTAEELTLLTNAIKRDVFSFNNASFLEIDNGSIRIILAVIEEKSSELDIQIMGGKLLKKLNNYANACVLVDTAKIAYNMALGMEMGGYRFDKYFTKKDKDDYPKIEKIEFMADELDGSGFAKYQALASAIRYARDLCNEPANNLTPKIFADDIKRLEYLGLEVEILDEKKIKSLGMGLLLSVAQGSDNLPRVAVIKWRGNKKKDGFEFGLVGKGVTFDSGGISIKPSSGMEDMKGDMTGAAIVAATLKAAALTKANKNLIGIVGLVENMPSGSATRPGDVVVSMSGQTVEVINTDAEGRLVLGDCLWYMQKEFNVSTIIDIATLTGSAAMTFGSQYAAILSNTDTMVEDVIKHGEASGEKVWRLPLSEEYSKMIDSSIADMKNIGGKYAGAITAACFLQRFIKPQTVWSHIDIAGVDKEEKGKPLYPKGATAFGVKLLCKVLNIA